MKTRECKCKFPHEGTGYRLWTVSGADGTYTPGPSPQHAFLNAQAHLKRDGRRCKDVHAWWIEKLDTGEVVADHNGPLTKVEARKCGLAV